MINLLKNLLTQHIMKKQKIIAMMGMIIVFSVVGRLLTTQPIILADFITQLSVGLIFTAITIGVWGFRDDLEKFFGKSENKESIDDFVLLTNYRERYHEDLKKLIQSVENKIPDTHTKTFFEALRISHPKEKRLVLQHFYVDENYFHKHFKLYTLYRRFVGFDNDIGRDKKELIEKISHFEEFLEKSCQKYHKSNMWFNKKKLEETLCLPKSIIELGFMYFLYPDFHKSIPLRLELIKKVENNERLFVINNNVIGGIKSDEHFHEITSSIQTQLRMIIDNCRYLEAGRAAVDEFLAQAYTQQVEMAIEPMKRGESMIGVCDGCIDYFSPNQKKKLQKFLNLFNDNWDNSEEATWTGKEKKSTFFSNTRSK